MPDVDEFEETYFIWEHKRSRMIDLRGQDFLTNVEIFKDKVILIVKVSNDEINLIMSKDDWVYFLEKIRKKTMSYAQLKSYAKRPRPKKVVKKQGKQKTIDKRTQIQKKRAKKSVKSKKARKR